MAITTLAADAHLNPVTRPLRTPEFTLTQLRYFVCAADWGSMTAAAGELYVAQSAISMSIAQLERAFGTELFIRKRAKGLLLTRAGKDLLPRARSILESISDTVDAVSSAEPQGRVYAACFVTLAPFVVPGIITEVSRRHPGLSANVRELNAADISRSLLNGEVDLAITYNLGLGPEFECEHIADAPLYVAVPRGHEFAGRDSVSLREVAAQPFVLLNLPSSRDYFLGVFADQGIELNTTLESDSFETVRALVAHGQGVSLLNQRPRTDMTYDGGHLEAVPITEPVPPMEIVIARLATTHTIAGRAKAFADAATDVVKQAFDFSGPAVPAAVDAAASIDAPASAA